LKRWAIEKLLLGNKGRKKEGYAKFSLRLVIKRGGEKWVFKTKGFVQGDLQCHVWLIFLKKNGLLLRFCFKMSGNGSHGGNFVANIVVAFLCYLLVPHKNNKERKTSKEGQRGKNCSGGVLKKKERGFQFHFSKKKTCCKKKF
jgi:hypothetical protein